MPTRWIDLLDWSKEDTFAALTKGYGARDIILDDFGHYAFIYRSDTPTPDNCLCIGRAHKQTVRKRMGKYLRATFDGRKAEQWSHEGRRRIAFARLNGVHSKDSGGIDANDRLIHACWCAAPFVLGPGAEVSSYDRAKEPEVARDDQVE